jgi:pimeloyl-ACP methyl ester carboxylesterase
VSGLGEEAVRRIADGVHLVESGKADGPLLLCLHGIGSSSRSFEQLAEDLGPDVRVVRWDAPGYARSADAESAPGIDGYADVAAELVRRLTAGREESAAHVLGVSWGGVIALKLAARHPELVASLTVADSSLGSGTDPAKAEAMRGRAGLLAEQGPEEFARARGPRLVSAEAPAELVERVTRTMAESIRLPGYAHSSAAMAEADLTGDLARIHAPALVICGDQDQVTGLDEAQRIAGGLRRVASVVVAGAGHLANQERPDAFHAWVRAHLHVVAGVPI